MNIRVFNKQDTKFFYNAVAWADGKPLIGDGQFTKDYIYTLVLDANGGYLITGDLRGQQRQYILRRKFTTQKAARTFIKQLGTPKQLTDLHRARFKRITCKSQ